ncbi:MAG: 2-oxo-4-hydroxy-4-carboxy-5-ureidoimidazoline decarboxylase [Rhizobiales bacterium]|nr:2-oxo-4-hydroxy-4-carboxy-5-ureidoimidazoline decarboxylase [Hyphomicrobiales bacterium]NRB14542.1 2-oxo-4-hydroxy-4-carboxy-5-ureidoimidazoline decarboxylase [Hyphomicrobiales bacterium]
MAHNLAQVNAMSVDAFTINFADIAEHSPWVATAAATARPFASKQAMIDGFCHALNQADRPAQLALIIAHPDLAGKAKLTADSHSEQSGAGLDSLTTDELTRFTALNASYKAKFKFPFIFAVKGADKHQILAGFEQRINNNPQQEFATALENICRIFMFRIEDQVQ